jgi:ATP-dependent 26S proteasome regulatory subunit
MAQKPLLPIGYSIQGETIKTRVNRVLNTEIYELTTGSYLYLITDIQLSDVIKDKIKKHSLFGTKVGLNEYVSFFSPYFELENLSKMKKSLTNKVGFEAIAGMHDLKELFMKEVIEPIKNPEKYKKYKLSIPNGILFF